MSETSNDNGPQDDREVPRRTVASAIRAPRASKGDNEISRRTMVSAAGIGWLALGGGAVIGGLAVQRFMFPNVSQDPDPQVPVGELRQYADMTVGGVNQAYKKQGILLVRLENKIVALSSACTHLGCIVNWFDSERVFKCPCHGSGFSREGINIDGPAPRPLERFKILVADGTVVVDRSKKYRHEKGEWESPESYIST